MVHACTEGVDDAIVYQLACSVPGLPFPPIDALNLPQSTCAQAWTLVQVDHARGAHQQLAAARIDSRYESDDNHNVD